MRSIDHILLEFEYPDEPTTEAKQAAHKRDLRNSAPPKLGSDYVSPWRRYIKMFLPTVH